MNSYFFEIVERAFDRFSWILVVYRKGRRRIIARANRDYGSPGKAIQAVERLKQVVGDAEIVLAFPSTPDFSFEALRDVLPLPVGSPESADDSRDRPRTTALARRRTARPSRAAAPVEPVPAAPATAEKAPTEEKAEEKAAAKRTASPAPRRRGTAKATARS